MTPLYRSQKYQNDYSYSVGNDYGGGTDNNSSVNKYNNIRPSIVLKSGINLTSGNGSKDNPYTV